MRTTIRALLCAALVAGTFGAAIAKLPPAPPLTDEQKAANAAKAKASADADNAQLARAMDRVAARYIAEQKAKGVIVTPQLPASGVTEAAPRATQAAAPGVHLPAKK